MSEKEKKLKEIIKDTFLELLSKDEDVRNMIVEIVKNAPENNGVRHIHSGDNALKKDNESLKQQLFDAKEDYSKLKENLKKLEKENESLQSENARLNESTKEYSLKYENAKKEISELEDKVSKLELVAERFQNYATLQDLYSGYLSLDEAIRDGLGNNIACEDIYQFVVSASQWDSIKSLWKYISYELDNLSKNDFDVLVHTFNWFFEQYNSFKKTYSLLPVQVGELFDSDFHAKSTNSKSLGNISEVLLVGYKNNITGNVVEKSIVRV